MIEEAFDGWRVVAYVDDVPVQTSTVFPNRKEARRAAEQVITKIKAKYPGKRKTALT